MKKIILLVFILTMTLSLFGCSSKTLKETDKNSLPNQSTTENNDKETNAHKQNESKKETWGTECTVGIMDSKKTVRIHISFPDRAGVERLTGLLNNQPDDTTTAFDVYREGNSPEVEKIEDLFPAYSDQFMAMFRKAYGRKYANNTLDVKPDGTEKIGDYEVTKFRGVHSYTLEGEEYNAQCVIYAVELKAGDYAYVMVQDISEDQSQVDLIESHAYNMVRSMWEE